MFVIPYYESERGWGSKVDGYSGPYETIEEANRQKKLYNLKYNNESVVPDYYIVALDPVPYTNQTCDYIKDWSEV